MPDTAGTLSVLAVRTIALGAARAGIAPPALCARFGLDPALIADVDGRVPVGAVVAMWESVPAMVGDQDFGLHLAEAAVAAPQGLGGRIIAAAPTLGDGLERMLRFERVFHDVRTSELTVDGDEAVLAHDTRGGIPLPRHAAEFAFAFLILLARRTTGAGVTPVAVEHRHAAPPSIAEHQRIFGVAPRFAAPVDRLRLRASDLARAQAGDHALAEILEAHARQLLERLPPANDTVSQVRAAIRRAIADGAPLGAVATALGTSARTLQRRLTEHGHTYQQLVDDERRELALRLLAAPATAAAEVAFALGFSEQSAFHRAFVRWTGQTPGAWRRQA